MQGLVTIYPGISKNLSRIRQLQALGIGGWSWQRLINCRAYFWFQKSYKHGTSAKRTPKPKIYYSQFTPKQLYTTRILQAPHEYKHPSWLLSSKIGTSAQYPNFTAYAPQTTHRLQSQKTTFNVCNYKLTFFTTHYLSPLMPFLTAAEGININHCYRKALKNVCYSRLFIFCTRYPLTVFSKQIAEEVDRGRGSVRVASTC